MKKLRTVLLLVVAIAMLIPIISVAANNCKHNMVYQNEKQTGVKAGENQHTINIKLYYKCSKCDEPETRRTCRRESHTFLTDSSKTTCVGKNSQFHTMHTVKKQSCWCGKARTQEYTIDYPHQFTRKYDKVRGLYFYKCGCGYQYNSDF